MSAQYHYLPVTAISDAQEGSNNLDHKIKPLDGASTLFGRALTMKLTAGNNNIVYQAIMDAKPGDVLVIDAEEYSRGAVSGDFMVKMYQKVGIAGLVVNGFVRDYPEIKKLGFPVFAYGTIQRASGKLAKGTVHIPITVGGVIIHPGDYVFGDCDGVTIVPQENMAAVFEKAQDIIEQEEAREAAVLASDESLRQFLEAKING